MNQGTDPAVTQAPKKKRGRPKKRSKIAKVAKDDPYLDTDTRLNQGDKTGSLKAVSIRRSTRLQGETAEGEPHNTDFMSAFSNMTKQPCNQFARRTLDSAIPPHPSPTAVVDGMEASPDETESRVTFVQPNRAETALRLQRRSTSAGLRSVILPIAVRFESNVNTRREVARHIPGRTRRHSDPEDWIDRTKIFDPGPSLLAPLPRRPARPTLPRALHFIYVGYPVTDPESTPRRWTPEGEEAISNGQSCLPAFTEGELAANRAARDAGQTSALIRAYWRERDAVEDDYRDTFVTQAMMGEMIASTEDFTHNLVRRAQLVEEMGNKDRIIGLAMENLE